MPMTLERGQILCNRYEILDVLGRGSFGVVYGALDNYDGGVGRRVAIKQMPMQSITDCERQADVRVVMNHPSIPSIFDCFALDDASYLVQEWVIGRDLDRVLVETSEPLPEKRVAGWGSQLASMLAYLHTHPIYPMIFRDMKPNNVMVDAVDRIYAVDFGLARIYPSGYWLSNEPLPGEPMRRGLAIGTEGYSPPEQYEGLLFPQSDIYALGATLHHLLTRRDPRKNPPFSFEQAPLRSLRPDVSQQMANLVTRAVDNEVDRRFSSASEMEEALARLI